MTTADVGLLILRVALGITMAAHGYNKFTGGGRIPGTAAWFDGIGMKPGLLHARVAATVELASGAGIVLGLLLPITVAAFVALMLVAALTVHRDNGFYIVNNGWEYNFVLAASALALVTIGSGRISVDQALFHGVRFFSALGGWWGLLIAAALGLTGGLAQLALFYRPPTNS